MSSSASKPCQRMQGQDLGTVYIKPDSGLPVGWELGMGDSYLL